jgi:hypothetical protein
MTSNENDKSSTMSPESGISESDLNSYSETGYSEMSDDSSSNPELGSVGEDSIEESSENGDASSENDITIESNSCLNEKNEKRPLRENNEATSARFKKRRHADSIVIEQSEPAFSGQQNQIHSAKQPLDGTSQKVKRDPRINMSKERKLGLIKQSKILKSYGVKGL